MIQNYILTLQQSTESEKMQSKTELGIHVLLFLNPSTQAPLFGMFITLAPDETLKVI